MKILSIVGARPQFIKAAAVSRRLRRSATEILVHTGQHYDDCMSRIFFEEMAIPEPDVNLSIGSGSHGVQTGTMLIAIENLLFTEKPDMVLVYGDTNSTLSGALAAIKLKIPIAHVEAGLRSYNRAMPEEINRVLTDHVSDILFCPSATAAKNLEAEGIIKGVRIVGDVMFEALRIAQTVAREKSQILKHLCVEQKQFALATIHRAENTDNPQKLSSLFSALAEISKRMPVVFPLHPRTRKAILNNINFDGNLYPNMKLIDPVGFIDMIQLESSACTILTDSGGIQKEAYWLQTPCVTLREDTEWVETVNEGWNVLVGADFNRIVAMALQPLPKPAVYSDSHLGRGSVDRLVEAIIEWFQ